MLELDFLLECLDYNKETGVFIWKVRPVKHFKNSAICDSQNSRVSGTVAGRISNNGYIGISIRKHRYLAHHLAWFICHGRLPKFIDHINGKRDDNRIANLRECTYSQNNSNTRLRSDNVSGLKGASYVAERGKWIAQISVNGKNKNLGRFATAEEAHAAYCRAADLFYGEFSNHGLF